MNHIQHSLLIFTGATAAWIPSDATSASVHRWLRKGQKLYQEENSGLGSTPSGTGDVVGRWEDFLLGHDKRMSQGTTSLKPLVQADGSISFDGVDDSLVGDWSGLSSSGHVFFRMKIRNDPPALGKTGLHYLTSLAGNSTHHPYITGGVYSAALSTKRKNDFASPDSFAVFHTWSVSSKSSEWIARYNGTIYLNEADNTFDSPIATATIGKSIGDIYLDGFIVEVVLFDAVLSAADLASMLDYMALL